MTADDHAPVARSAPDALGERRIGPRGLWLGTALAVAVLAAAAWLAWRTTHPAAGPTTEAGSAAGSRFGASARRMPPPTTVGVASAEHADVPVVLEALGTVTPVATVTVRPQVSGVLEKVLFREGQMVKAGELLAIIDPRPFELALMQVRGQRQRDEAELENARLTLQRYRTLLTQDSIARQDVDTQAALVKQLEATILTDRAAEGTAKLNLSYSRITAPLAGRVGLRNVDAGNLVGTSDAAGIAVITQIAPIDVEFAVPQDRVPEVQAGAASGAAMPVRALDRTRSTTLATGRFATLDNQIDVQTGTVRAKARFDNAAGTLFPSQFVNVRLQLRTLDGAVVVPVTALRHGSQGDYVYVLDAATRTVALRTVVRGQDSGDKVVIASGLAGGEQVITEGADRLKDGATVALPGDAPASGAGFAHHGRHAASGTAAIAGHAGSAAHRRAASASGASP